MYRDLLPFLQCPTCSYAPVVLLEDHVDEGEVIRGGVRCGRCCHVAPIKEGILDALEGAPVPWTPAQLTNYLPATAWGYERLWRRQALGLLSGARFPLEDELRLIRGLLAPWRGGLVLDVACSTGLYARAFATAARGTTIAGVDHSWAMLFEARQYAQRAGHPISFVRASAQALPFAGSSATGYGMGGSLNEIGDIDAALREARRVLRAGGRLVSMNLLRANSGRGRLLQRLLMAGGIEFPAEEQLKRHFTGAGLRLVAHWRWRVVAVSLLLPE